MIYTTAMARDKGEIKWTSDLRDNQPVAAQTFEVGQANIKVIGVGGSGNNIVGWLYKRNTGSRNNCLQHRQAAFEHN